MNRIVMIDTSNKHVRLEDGQVFEVAHVERYRLNGTIEDCDATADKLAAGLPITSYSEQVFEISRDPETKEVKYFLSGSEVLKEKLIAALTREVAHTVLDAEHYVKTCR